MATGRHLDWKEKLIKPKLWRFLQQQDRQLEYLLHRRRDAAPEARLGCKTSSADMFLSNATDGKARCDGEIKCEAKRNLVNIFWSGFWIAFWKALDIAHDRIISGRCLKSEPLTSVWRKGWLLWFLWLLKYNANMYLFYLIMSQKWKK